MLFYLFSICLPRGMGTGIARGTGTNAIHQDSGHSGVGPLVRGSTQNDEKMVYTNTASYIYERTIWTIKRGHREND